MWSYSFEIPTLLVILILLVFYFSRPRLPLKKNLLFLQMIAIETLVIIFDIAASAADNNYQSVPKWIVVNLNMFYFIGFFTWSFVMFCFSLSVTRASIVLKTYMKYILSTPFYLGIIFSLVSPFLRLIFYVDDLGYHPGILYPYIYVVGFSYALTSLFIICRFRRAIPKREFYTMVMYNNILIISLIVRIAFPTTLLMDTFVLIDIIIVYLGFENPEYFLELRSTVFNSTALREYIEENAGKMDYKVIGIVVHRYQVIREIYGANQTDIGLSLIGKYLKQFFPKNKIFYNRKGRFVVFVDPKTDVEYACKNLSKRFRMPWKSEEAELYLTPGFATIDLSGSDYTADEILGSMSRILEKAGNSESGEIFYISKEDVQKNKTDTLVRRYLESAIDNNTVELYLQPLVNRRGRIVGAEALARIKDFEGNIIPPGMFIPLAESSGRINEMGEQIFEKTCSFMRYLMVENINLDWINVNLSPIQFVRTDLAERYSAIAKKHKVDPGLIHLEITEESVVDESFMTSQIQALGEKGFKFVLDDYGTGYSNLSRLKKCPFINIKLDKSLVWGYDKNPDVILPNMVSTFKSMGFGITAEGIENTKMEDEMKEIGCDYLQGFLYSKPIPTSEFIKLFNRR
ncbi:MAG: EAL domain-containing protein [Lachnospiraceae bacterium]|nr:EAL domain-containing protein [Lachnospiraceae bacterium]